MEFNQLQVAQRKESERHSLRVWVKGEKKCINEPQSEVSGAASELEMVRVLGKRKGDSISAAFQAGWTDGCYSHAWLHRRIPPG